tara:strand:- start:45 stop:3212 length:3168 start_codon:yes stop_codon:yes gene_type:complete
MSGNKNIRLQLFDVTELQTQGSNFVTDGQFNSNTNWVLNPLGTSAWSISGGLAHKGTGQDRIEQILDVPLVENQQYRLVFKVMNFNGVGFLALSQHGLGGVNIDLNPFFTSAAQSASGEIIQIDWIQGNTNTDRLSLLSNTNTVLEIDNVQLFELGSSNKNFVGELDVSTDQDFPLSLNFQIASSQEITAKKGAYSKTFKIPATANNNKLLKNLNIINSTNKNADINTKKRCRIIVGDLYSLDGLLKITGMNGVGKINSYSCVFYGDNLSWATDLDNKYMSDLVLDNSTNLELKPSSIVQTWQSDDALQSTDASGTVSVNTSPVVYPIAAYGKMNETGREDSIQLLQSRADFLFTAFGSNVPQRTGYYGAHDNNNSNYNNPEPVLDWRPMIWVYRLFKKIFQQAGYTINSNFIESSLFKKLLYATPNFKYNNSNDRYQLFSYEARFTDNTTNPFSQTSARFFNNTMAHTYTSSDNYDDLKSFTQNVSISNAGNFIATVDNQPFSQGTSIGSDHFNIRENGYYTCRINNFFANLSQNYYQSTQTQSGITIRIVNIEFIIKVRTVGEPDYHDVVISETGTLNGDMPMSGHQGIANAGTYNFGINFPNIEERRYFNNGDRIKLAVRTTVQHATSSSSPPVNTSFRFKLELFGQSYSNFLGGATNRKNGVFNLEFEAEKPAYGQTYNLQDVLNKNQKQIDFVKGIAHAFNLQFQTDEIRKIITIEPYNNFYQGISNSIDWSSKVDRSKDINDTWLQTNLKRRLIFKYKTDSKDEEVASRGNLFFDGVLDEYPYIENLSSNYERGDLVFENPFFAGTFSIKDRQVGENTSDTFYLAGMYEMDIGNSTQNPTRPDKGFDFTPRLLYYNRLANSNIDVKRFSVQTATVVLPFYTNYIQCPTTPFTCGYDQNTHNIPQCIMYDREDYTNGYNLAYGNVWARDYDAATDSYTNAQIKIGLYETYYREQIENLKASPRKRILYVDLKITDIIDLSFRKLIHIDGVYYTLEKICDYKPHKNISTKVELIENKFVGSMPVTDAVFISPSGGVNTQQGNEPDNPLGNV